MQPRVARVIKKYSNRRLYDTEESRYVTLEELTETIRAGRDVRVVDAQSGADLTQVTLTQAIIEGRGAGKLLPVPLLLRLIRLGDDALGEFLGRYMALALESYLQIQRGARTVSAYNPFAAMPLNAANAFARMFSELAGWGDPRTGYGPPNAGFQVPPAQGSNSQAYGPSYMAGPGWTEPSPTPEVVVDETSVGPGPASEPPPAGESEVSALRRELDELKSLITASQKPAKASRRSKKPKATE